MRAYDSIPEAMELKISRVPSSFTGKLFFILGPGLGDTVNDLRILHKVFSHYPDAVPIVYADPRWKEVYDCIPELQRCDLQYHTAAPSTIPQPGEAAVPYYRTFKDIMQKIVEECGQNSGLIALANFKLSDQLAKKESTFMMKARAIELSLKESERRPYFPVHEEARNRARQFLNAQGLSPGRFIIVAPYTWPGKMWDQGSWETLVDRLYETTGLPVLLISVPGYPKIDRTYVREALGFSLPQVAALIAQAKCYIGLDTGPTHVAACFDVPIVSLNPQGEFPPFLIEPHSPFKWIHLTPGVYGSKPIPMESVFEIACKSLEHPSPPGCPVCGLQPYVLGARRGSILYLCRCGLIFRITMEKTVKEKNTERIPANPSGESIALPRGINELADFCFRLHQMKERSDKVTFLFEHWDSIETDPFALMDHSTPDEVWWNWDSVYAFLSSLGWHIVESRLRPLKALNGATFEVEVGALSSQPEGSGVKFPIPWGRKTITVNRSIYERWLTWGAFRNQAQLEGIGWNLVNRGQRKEGLFILKMAVIIQLRWAGLRRFILASLGVFRR